MPIMKSPRQLAVSAALAKSNACFARGVFGRVFRPIQVAITPQGTLIANSHGHVPADRMAGSAMFAIAVSSEASASAVKIAATAQRLSSGGTPSMGAAGGFAVVSSDIPSGSPRQGGGRALCGVYYGRGTSHRHAAA